MVGPPSEDDPGWTPVLRSLAWFAIPGIGVQQMYKRASHMNGLTALRLIYVAFVNALVLIGAVIAILVNLSKFRGGSVPAVPVAAGVAVEGVLAQIVGVRFERALDCADDQRFAASYRNRFFVRVAFAESTALLGFAAFIGTGRWWLYPLGAAFAAVGYARLAPTSAHLAQDEEQLRSAGCAKSVVRALAAGIPRGRSWGAGTR